MSNHSQQIVQKLWEIQRGRESYSRRAAGFGSRVWGRRNEIGRLVPSWIIRSGLPWDRAWPRGASAPGFAGAGQVNSSLRVLPGVHSPQPLSRMGKWNTRPTLKSRGRREATRNGESFTTWRRQARAMPGALNRLRDWQA